MGPHTRWVKKIMNMPLFFGTLGVVVLLYLLIGKLSAKAIHTEEDYYLGGRRLGFTTMILTILATQIGGASLIGAADLAYHQGWVALLYATGIAAGLVLLSMGVGAKIRTHQVETLPELFEKVFASKFLRQVAAALSITSLFFILIVQCVATRKLIAAVGFDNPFVFISLWCVLISYTVAGGFKAVVNTDVFQALFVLGAFIVALVVAVIKTPVVFLDLSLQMDFVAVPWSSWLLMPMLFMIIGQDMGQRCSAAVSPKTVSRAMIVTAVIYLLFALIPVVFGIVAKQLQLAIPADQSVLFTALSHLTNPSMTAIATCALLMAIVSTADSLLCAISFNLALDFVWLRKFSGRSEITFFKAITFFIGVAAVCLSYAITDVIPFLIQAYELSISVLFVPIFLTLIMRAPPRAAAYGAMIAGVVGYGLLHRIAFGFHPQVLTLGLAVLGAGVGMLWARISSRHQPPREAP